ncbi:MAG: hypothetical protein LUH03_04440 [Oscillospiraceae bacterium]|nr:hypothetical protein [Oscillospiraceae bacterium]
MGKGLMKRLGICFVLCFLVAALFCACEPFSENNEDSVSNSGGNVEMELTQRQIQILMEVGLPTEYDELTDSQKNDIMAIEEMLCYLELTYDVEASYKSFVQASLLNDESLTALINDKEVTVSRHYQDGDYVYDDNYDSVISEDRYEEELKSYFDEREIVVKVYAEISDMENGVDDVLSSANASVFVFVLGDFDHENLEALANDYGEWYSPKLNGVANVTRFYAVSESAWLDIGESNYYDCLQEVSTENRIICVISSDGSINVK